MSPTSDRFHLRRLRTLATGYAGFHATNSGLSIVYTLTQTLVLSRVLDHRTFSQIVAIQAAGLYLQPFNQAVARGNFVLLRERIVRNIDATRLPEAAAAFHFNQILFLIASLVVPALVGASGAKSYFAMATYLFASLYSNVWYSEIQMALMAVERQMRFEAITVFRRISSFALIVLLFISKDFFIFCMLLFAQTLVFHAYIVRDAKSGAGMFSWPAQLGWRDMRAHCQRLWISFQATLAEWTTLNGPYMVFQARFGIGAELVAVDAIMKVLRVVVTVARNLSEIALPRISRALLGGQGRSGLIPAGLVLAGGGAVGVVGASAVAFWPRQTFDLLLGPNNTVPVAAGLPAAIIIMSGVAFASATHLIGYSGHARIIRRVMWFAGLSVCGFAAYMMLSGASVVAGFWAFAITFGVVSLMALLMLIRLLTGYDPPAAVEA